MLELETVFIKVSFANNVNTETPYDSGWESSPSYDRRNVPEQLWGEWLGNNCGVSG